MVSAAFLPNPLAVSNPAPHRLQAAGLSHAIQEQKLEPRDYPNMDSWKAPPVRYRPNRCFTIEFLPARLLASRWGQSGSLPRRRHRAETMCHCARWCACPEYAAG
jgi:hypothetical protein